MARAVDQNEASGRCGLAFLNKLWVCERITDASKRDACYNRAIEFYNNCMDRAGFPK